MVQKKSRAEVPDGRAYGRRAQHPDRLPIEVGPGTPMGELLRRDWKPVGVSRDLGALPKRVPIMQRRMLKRRIRIVQEGGIRTLCASTGPRHRRGSAPAIFSAGNSLPETTAVPRQL